MDLTCFLMSKRCCTVLSGWNSSRQSVDSSKILKIVALCTTLFIRVGSSRDQPVQATNDSSVSRLSDGARWHHRRASGHINLFGECVVGMDDATTGERS